MERKYAMTRLQTGDYIVLSNDGETLCRVCSYEEDGSAEDGRGRYITGIRWNSFHFNGSVPDAADLMERDPDAFMDVYEWKHWLELGTLHRTRRGALDCAFRAAERGKVAAVREP